MENQNPLEPNSLNRRKISIKTIVIIIVVGIAILSAIWIYSAKPLSTEIKDAKDAKDAEISELTKIYQRELFKDGKITFPGIKSQTTATQGDIKNSLSGTFRVFSMLMSEGAKIGSATKVEYADGSSGYQVVFLTQALLHDLFSQYREVLVQDKTQVLSSQMSDYADVLEAQKNDTHIQIILLKEDNDISVNIRTITSKVK